MSRLIGSYLRLVRDVLDTDPSMAKSQLSMADTFAAVTGGFVRLLQSPAPTATTGRFMVKASDGKHVIRGYGATPNDALIDARRIANR